MASDFHIPFRCPNCGDSRKFDTLHDLRRHLENDHSYTSSRYRHRPVTSSPAVGVRPRVGRHSPLMEMFHSDAQRLEESLRKNKEDELNNKKRRSEFSDAPLHNSSASNLSLREKIQNISPHPSFREYGHPSRLHKYYTPSKHVRDRHNLGGLPTNNTFYVQSYLNDKSMAEPYSEISELLARIDVDERAHTASAFPNIHSLSQVPSSVRVNPSEQHIQETLSALSHEVLVERASQYATADSLYTAQELLSSVEQAAEIKIAQQKKVIEVLAEKLKEKESRLTGVMHQIETLTHHQVDSMEKVSALKQQSDLRAELLQKQLDQKQKDFDTLNQKLFEIQQSLVKGNPAFLKAGKDGDNTHPNVNFSRDSGQLSVSLNLVPELEEPLNGSEKLTFDQSATKDKEIKKVRNKAQQLERDRQNLLIEMQNLLEAAAVDNEKLQSELASQNQELSQLNFDLEQSKHEQEELLGETHALYRQADVSLAKLKLLLRDREEELKNVNKSLEHAKAAQAKLARERDEYQRLCQDRETKYMQMMSTNTEQVRTMKKTLDSSLQEKKKLEEKLRELRHELATKNGKDAVLSENVARLKSALEDKMRSQSKMKEELQKREDKLKKAKREMERMTKFLEDTAEKELEARSKLEDFISGLIDRAGKAEADLQKLKESYRLQQTSRESLKKHKRESKELDLSSLPGASSIIHKPSFEYDPGSLSSSMISNHIASEDKVHYHSTPKGTTIQQTTSASIPKMYSQRNHDMPNRHHRDKSMKYVDEVDSDVHSYSGDGNIRHFSEPSPSLQNDKPFNHNGTSGTPDTSYQQYGTEKLKLQGKKVVVLSSDTISQEPNPSSIVSGLHACSACSHILHAAHNSVCPMKAFESHQASDVTHSNHSNAPLNVSQTHQLHSHPVSHESMSLHVVPYSNVTNSITQHVSLPQFQCPTLNPLALYKEYPVNQPGWVSLPHNKESTSTEVPDKLLFSPGTIFPHFAPVYFNSSPHFCNNVSVDPYNLYTDWSKQLKLSLPAFKDDEMDNSLYSAYLKSKEFSMFKNIPEVDQMFANVFKHSPYAHNFETPPLTEESRKSYKETRYPKQQKMSSNLPIDENGIMWESQSRDHSKNHRGKHHTPDNLMNNDDTDIDEDLTDFIYDTEPATQGNQDSSQYFIAKKKDANTLTKTHRQCNQPPPLGAKIAKVLASDDAKNYTSSARDHYNKYLVPNTSKMPQKSSNDYSTEESTEDSPLDKAKVVQKRLENFTNDKPGNVFISKQSEGFDVSHMDSDFSTSSYQSLYKPITNAHLAEKLPFSEEIKERTNKKAQGSFLENVQPLGTVNRQNLPETKIKQRYPQSEDVVEKDPVLEVMEKETITRKPNFSAIEPGEKTSEKYIHEYPKTVKQDSAIQSEVQPLIVQGNAHMEVKRMLDSIECLNPPSTQQTVVLAEPPLPVQNEELLHTAMETAPTSQKDTMPDTVLLVKDEQSIEIEVWQGQDLNKINDQDIQHSKEASGALLDNGLEENEEVSETSSDEDYAHQVKDCTKASARKESMDASTDTDLEKLAKPGYVQKGLVVRKNIPTVKHIRKNKRRKPALKRATSEESSGADDLDEGDKERRRFIRRMRVALFRIFSYLDTTTLLKISRVSREWCKVSRHPALWKVVTLENKAISSKFLITLSQWCTQTQSLRLQGLTARSINENETAEEYNSSIRCSLEAGLEKFLSSCQNTITQLHIDDCDNILTDKCLWIVSGYCRLLTKLTYRSAVDCVTPQLMWALGGGCPGVTSLFVQPKSPFKVNGMNNRCLLLIGQFYKDIQEIGLAGKEFDSAGLNSLVQSCQRLRVIHLEHCLSITSDLASNLCKVGLKNLHSLSILGTTVEAKALQNFQGNSRQLKMILVKMNIESCVADSSKKKDKENYKKMVKSLEGLKSKAGFGNIFRLEAGPAE